MLHHINIHVAYNIDRLIQKNDCRPTSDHQLVLYGAICFQATYLNWKQQQ